MDATDELKEEGLLDFLMAVDGREERLGHIIVFVVVLSDAFDRVHHVGIQRPKHLIPDLTLVENFFYPLIYLLIIFGLVLEVIKLVILHLNVHRCEDQLVRQVPHSLQARNAALSVSNPPGIVASGCELGLFTRFEHTRELG